MRKHGYHRFSPSVVAIYMYIYIYFRHQYQTIYRFPTHTYIYMYVYIIIYTRHQYTTIYRFPTHMCIYIYTHNCHRNSGLFSPHFFFQSPQGSWDLDSTAGALQLGGTSRNWNCFGGDESPCLLGKSRI